MKQNSTLGAALFACFTVAACGGVDASDPDHIDSEGSALVQSGNLGATETPPAATQTTAEAASCTATSDGGKWCCVPIQTPPGLSCTYTPPPPVVSTLTARGDSVFVARKLQVN